LTIGSKLNAISDHDRSQECLVSEEERSRCAISLRLLDAKLGNFGHTFQDKAFFVHKVPKMRDDYYGLITLFPCLGG